ncbi:phosphotransferase [Nocardia sp. NPDC019255]|uniref:phosphotransferase n=1 Tax=Nocardia sp. NPDC019255 TaxID=3154591 RepID=UPI00340395CC
MATYTTVDDIDIGAVTTAYNLTEPTFDTLKGGYANSSFSVDTPTGRYVLTYLDNHTPTTAQHLAELTQALHHNGFRTTEPIPTIDGHLTTTINGRPVMLKHWIEGHVLDPLPDELLTDAGAALAHLHNLPDTIPNLPQRTRRLSRETETHTEEFADREFADWITTRLDRVRDLHSTQPDTFTHGDLFADNIIVCPDNSLVILDWETASNDDPLLDLGMTVVGLIGTAARLTTERVHRIIYGYNRIRHLGSTDQHLLPRMIEHAGLIIAFHRYYRHNVRYPNPDYADMYRSMVAFVEAVDGIEL